MNVLKCVAVVSLVFLIAVSPCFALGCLASSEGDVASSAVGDAEAALDSAYRVVLEAEEAGANVSGLLERLNVAAEHLALADVCLKLEDFDGAAGNAGLCVEALDGIEGEAGVLRDEAVVASGERSWRTIGGSMVGVVAVVFAAVLSWWLFKKRYYRRVLEMKPEVVEG